jgi:serine/threonine-protein kinase HipA
MTGLEVWLDEHEVGWLKPVDGEGARARLSLRYLERWTSEALAFPLAPSLPLPARGGPGSELAHDAVLTYFENLLPEGEARRKAFAALGLPQGDVFGALQRMGRDMAGAVRLLPERRERPAGPAQRPITREELSERIRSRDTQAFGVWDGQVRGTLAGCQDKLGVYVEPDGGWHLVDGPQMASTHVLKPAPVSEPLGDLPFNEYFCMSLAARVGLDVAPVQLHRVPEPVLLVQRFDRQRLDDGRVRRLHVIDARQAAGRADLTDAERFALLKHSPMPLVDSRALLRWTLFRDLIGSGRASADNLSFLVDHGGLRVAPAYGLTSREAVAVDDWAAFAHDCDIAPRSLALEMKRMSEAVRAQVEALADDLAGEVPRQVAARIVDVVNDKARRMAGFAVSG